LVKPRRKTKKRRKEKSLWLRLQLLKLKSNMRMKNGWLLNRKKTQRMKYQMFEAELV